MKGTYVFEQGLGAPQTMILDDLTLYIPRGAQYERAVFDDEKAAVQGFNRIMMAYFSPKSGWRIKDKKMGVAVPPPPEQIVGYEAPPSDVLDLGKTPVHLTGDRLVINVERVEPPELEAALVQHRASVRHLWLYARHKAVAGLAGLLRNPWPGLRTLVIDSHDVAASKQAGCRVGDLSVLLPQVPDLQRLYVRGQVGFAKPVLHKSLEHLSMLGNPLPTTGLAPLAGCSLPALHTLELAVAVDHAPDAGWLEAVVGFVKKARALRELSLEGPMDIAPVLAMLAAVGQQLPATVRVLGDVRDVDAVVKAAAELSRHEALFVPTKAVDAVSAALEGVAVAEATTRFSPDAWGHEAWLAPKA